jgi:alanine racemase
LSAPASGSLLEIDSAHLRGNVDVFRQLVGRDRALMAVVKANAYGHGVALVAPAIRDLVDWFGVDSLPEAIEVHELGVERPILILGHCPLEDVGAVVRHGLRVVVYRRDFAEALDRAGKSVGRIARVHVEVETGLHRLGVARSELGFFASWLHSLENVEVEGVYTHFADVENPDSTLFLVQLRRLRDALEVIRAAGHAPQFVHAFPSAGVLLHTSEKRRTLNLARMGIGLYGIWPSVDTRAEALARRPKSVLRPALRWVSRLAHVSRVGVGETVGYDCTFTANTERLVGVVPVGYADGYDRTISNRGHVLVRGKKAPVVGVVAMNMMMVDVTEAGAENDDEVVLVGEQGGETVTLDDLAGWSETISYEIAARLGRHLPRRLV